MAQAAYPLIGTPGWVDLSSEIPEASHWLVYFGVTDTDAAAVKVTELGGTVTHPPEDIAGDIGRFAIARDPQGGAFGLLRYKHVTAP